MQANSLAGLWGLVSVVVIGTAVIVEARDYHPVQPNNRLSNASFETLDEDGVPVGWRHSSEGGDTGPAPDRPHHGEQSLAITLTDDRAGERFHQTVGVTPGKSYLVRGWMVARDITVREGGDGPRIVVYEGESPEGEPLATAGPGADASGQFNWRQFEAGPFEVGDAGRVTVLCAFEGATGTIWFDDIELVSEDEAEVSPDAPVRARLELALETVIEAADKAGNADVRRRAEALREKMAQIEELPHEFDRRSGPPYFPFHERIYKLMAELHAADHDGRPLVVQFTPPFARQRNLTYPTFDGDDSAMIHALRDDTEQLTVNLTNTTQEPMEVRLRLSGPALTRHLERSIWREVVTVEHWNNWLLDDALPLAAIDYRSGATNPGWGRITVPAGASRQMWLELHTNDAPGTSQGRIAIEWDGGQKELPVRLRVHNLTFPDEWPIYTHGYQYLRTMSLVSDRIQQAVEDLDRHHVNMMKFHQYGEAPPLPVFSEGGELLEDEMDWTDVDVTLQYAHHRKLFLIQLRHPLISSAGRRALGGGEAVEFGSELWHERAGQWIAAVVRGFEQRGISKDRLLFEPSDEPSATEIDQIITIGEMIHDVDPALIRYSNIATGRLDPEHIHEIGSAIDIWVPSENNWTNKALMNAFPEDAELWGYDVNGRSIPPRRIRAIFAHAHRLGMRGMSFWSYTSPHWGRRIEDGPNVPVDPWNQFANESRVWAVVYDGDPREVTPSKRWEAWREGVEDYTLLWMAERAVEHASAGGRDGEAIARLRELLNEYAQVQAQQNESWMETLRPELIEALATVSGELP